MHTGVYNIQPLIRSKDPYLLNFFLNHSAIYPYLIQDDAPEYLDVTEILKDENVFFFAVNRGGLLFLPISDKVYKIDAYFLPRNRGVRAKNVIAKAIKYMFEQAKADKIIAEIPACNKHSAVMASSMDFKKVRTDKNAWFKNGVQYDVATYELRALKNDEYS